MGMSDSSGAATPTDAAELECAGHALSMIGESIDLLDELREQKPRLDVERLVGKYPAQEG